MTAKVSLQCPQPLHQTLFSSLGMAFVSEWADRVLRPDRTRASAGLWLNLRTFCFFEGRCVIVSGGETSSLKTAKTLKILLVDEYEQRAEALEKALRDNGYSVVIRASARDYLPACVQNTEPDVILIDVDAPGRDTLEQISVIHRQAPRPVVLFTQEQDRDAISRAIRAGVSAYVVDGVNAARVQPIIDSAVATFNAFQDLRNELERTKITLSDRKTVDRAKGILMSQRGLTEGAAYKMMQKMAMDRKRKLADIARDVIEMAELFGSSAGQGGVL